MIVVGITGASGVIYGIRLLKALNELNIENSLIISDAAKTVINHEVKEPIAVSYTHLTLPTNSRV